MTITLKIQPLTRQAFKPFGDVIQVDDDCKHFTINDGSTERYHDLAYIEPGTDGHAIVSIFRGQPRQLPMPITMMERHPLASQAFIPLGPNPYLAIVAPAKCHPNGDNLVAFYCQAGQGINYAKGVWHHPLLALDSISDFLVIDRSGPGANCDVVTLKTSAILNHPE